MGPKTENVELLKEMIKSGMNVARFNFSHGSHEEHAGRMAFVEEARKAVTPHSPFFRIYASSRVLRTRAERVVLAS